MSLKSKIAASSVSWGGTLSGPTVTGGTVLTLDVPQGASDGSLNLAFPTTVASPASTSGRRLFQEGGRQVSKPAAKGLPPIVQLMADGQPKLTLAKVDDQYQLMLFTPDGAAFVAARKRVIYEIHPYCLGNKTDAAGVSYATSMAKFLDLLLQIDASNQGVIRTGDGLNFYTGG